MKRLLVVGLTAFLPAQDPTPGAPFPWLEDLATAHARSRADGRPVIAYFTYPT